MSYRDANESLRARVAELEAEVATLRPNPTGPMRWSLPLMAPVRPVTIAIMWLVILGRFPLMETRWHAPFVAVGLVVQLLSCARRVPA